jgi:branched-chain amino acid transport system permease protein
VAGAPGSGAAEESDSGTLTAVALDARWGQRLGGSALLASLLGLVVAVSALAPPATAQVPDPAATTTIPGATTTSAPTTSIPPDPSLGAARGTLIDRKGTEDSADDSPIRGARIRIEAENEDQVFEGETDASGQFRIPLAGEGSYTATLVEDSLPDDVDVDDGGGRIEFSLGPGQTRTLLFPLNAATRLTEGKFDLFLQALVDGTYFGLLLALAAVGLSLIYGTTGLVNFAHGELVTLGAIFAFWFNRDFGWPLIPSGILALLAAAAAGWLLDAGFWGPLRRRGTGNTALMVISIGVALAALNFYLYVFGGLTRPYGDYHAQAAIEFGTVSIPPKRIVGALLCLACLVAVATALQRTRTGKAMRAIADSPDLAASSGVHVDRVIRFVWMFGAGLAALGGILFSLSQDVNYEQGSSMLLLLFAAITLGGLGAAYGALIGGFVIGLFVSISAVWIPTELKNVGALAVLILVLLVRPQGILGRRERIG